MKATAKGIVASGHPETSRAAADILEAGGNAFDAALAALCACCVAEPLLASLAGGGFLLAHQAGEHRDEQRVYDFFSQTPSIRRDPKDIEFFPFRADFGADEQEFHIGLGSMAVPGAVAGLFAAHRDLATLPMTDIVAPAVRLARQGVRINARQAYIVRVLSPMLQVNPQAADLYRSGKPNETFITEGERHFSPDQATALETLAAEGPEVFYRGEWAEHVVEASSTGGGQLSLQDLASYEVVRREPVRFRHRDGQCAINAPPSPGGSLVAFALGMLDRWLGEEPPPWGTPGHLLTLLQSMRAANLAREGLDREGGVEPGLLAASSLEDWRSRRPAHPLFPRGTTHISVADADGNLASLTVSNGEGCGYIIPGTGIMMNNMLGEQDLNPTGFHRWPENTRMASMMSPAVVVRDDGRRVALGTGGSNRIRSAMLQVLSNLLDFDDSLDEAVRRPRIHLEGDKLSVEGGFEAQTNAALEASVALTHVWPEANMFFGGVNAVEIGPDGFEGASDPRREGCVLVAGG